MRKKTFERLWALCLSLAMILTTAPIISFAAESGIIMNFDFNELEVGKGVAGWLCYTQDSLDKISVEIDPVTESKALRIFKGDNSDKPNNEAVFRRTLTAEELEGIEFGVIRYSYKIRFESHKQYVTNCGGLASGYKYVDGEQQNTVTHPVRTFTHQNSLVFKYENGGNDQMTVIPDLTLNPLKYYKIDVIVNTITDTHDLYIDDVLIFQNEYFWDGVDNAPTTQVMNIDGFKQISFAVRNNTNGAGNHIMWIDDIVLERLTTPKVIGTTPETDATNVSLRPTVEIQFDTQMQVETINKTNIKVLNGEVEMPAADYNLNTLIDENNNTLLAITFNKDLRHNTTYTVKVSKSVKSDEGISSSGLEEDYITTFTTEEREISDTEIFDIFDDVENGLLPPGYTVTASSAGDSVAVENGMLKIVKASGTLNSALQVVRNNSLETAGKKMVVEFDAKFENHSQLLDEFPIIESKSGDIAAWGYTSGNVFATKSGYENTPLIENISADPTKWYNIKYVIDSLTNKHDVYIDNKITASSINMPLPNGAQIDGIGNVVFSLRCSNPSGANEVVWIDNLKITPVVNDLEVASVLPVNAATNVAINTEWKATFDREINPLTVIPSNIEVKNASGTAINFVANLEADKKTVKIAFVNSLEKNTLYTVTLKSNIMDTNSAKMAENAVYTFTTSSEKPGSIVDYDFDGSQFSVGSPPTGWYSYSADPLDKTTVEIDPVTNSKALRIFKKDNPSMANNEVVCRLEFAGAEHGIFRYSYKLRFESHNQYITSGGGFGGAYKYVNGVQSSRISPLPVLSNNNRLLFKHENGSSDTIEAVSNLKADPLKYYKFDVILSTITDTYDFYVDDVLIKANMLFTDGQSTGPATQVMDIDGFKIISFNVRNNANGAGDEIFWVDDIVLEKLTLPKVIGTTPAKDATNVMLRPTVEVQFNAQMRTDDINKTNVEILNGGIKIPEEDYNLSILSPANESTKFAITFNKDLHYKTTYTVKVSKEIRTDEVLSLGLAENYTTTFTTRPQEFDVYNITLKNSMGVDVGALNEVAGETVFLNAMVKNNDLVIPQPYAITIVIEDENGAMISVQNLIGTLSKGESTLLLKEIQIPLDATANHKIKVFTWTSYINPKPLFEKIIKP